MQTPVCELCAATNYLCSGCQAKLADGRITELDVQVAHLLSKYKEKFALQKVQFDRALDLGRMAIILTSSDVSHLVGRGGKTAQALSKELGKRVRVVHSTTDSRALLEQILLPVKPTGVNTVFTQKGKQLKVRISRNDVVHLPTDLDSINRVLHSLLGDNAVLVFE
ncbi:hypothetical protein H0O03_00370 [Candidatus Micrarchaeota archaeon]|nr:hypothetical protein [Candidatus Micrarchaeota archaeon]